MKQQLLDWWKGTFDPTEDCQQTFNNHTYIIDLPYSGKIVWKVWHHDPNSDLCIECDSIDQAYEASLIHYLQQNKGLLEIVFIEGWHEGTYAFKTDTQAFETWFKEVTN